MPHNSTVWATLERWSPIAFLAAGGLFVLPTAIYGIGVATGAGGNVVSPVVIFVSMLVVFVGLLGLYPRLAEADPILSLGGLGLLAVTASIIIGTLSIAALPNGPTFGKPHILVIAVSVVIGSTLTLATFGVASLRTGVYPRRIGSSLLAMAAGTAFVFVSMLLYSAPTPPWTGFVPSVLFVVTSASVGFVLRNEASPGGTAESTDDVIAG